MTELSAINRASWNERAAIHARDATEYYMVDRFLAGADTLFPVGYSRTWYRRSSSTR